MLLITILGAKLRRMISSLLRKSRWMRVMGSWGAYNGLKVPELVEGVDSFWSG